MERVLELVSHMTLYKEICMQLQFIKENCNKLMNVIRTLEGRKEPLAPIVYSLLEDLEAHLGAGAEKNSFGSETDQWLSKYSLPEKKTTHQIFSECVHACQKEITRAFG